MDEQIQQLNNRVEDLEYRLNHYDFSSRDVNNKFCDFPFGLKPPVVSADPSVGEIGQIATVGTTLKHCTATTPTWKTILFSDGDGSSLTGISVPNVTKSFTAGQDIAAGDVVSIGPYQSDGGVKLDAKAVADATKSFSFTVGNNSNRILVVFGFNAAGNSFTVTAGGVAMTNAANSGITGYAAVYYLVAPGVGSITIATGSADADANFHWSVYSYYQAAQTGQPDLAAVQTNPSGYSQAITADGSLVVGAGVGLSGVTTSGTVYTYNKQTNASSYIDAGDAGIVYPTGQTVTITATSGGTCVGFLFGVVPVTTTSEFVLTKASAANVSNQYFKPYNCVIGIAPSAISAAATGNVTLAGRATGLSGLSGLSKVYYLSDTPGAISTTAGTNSKKIGVNDSSTSLLLQLS